MIAQKEEPGMVAIASGYTMNTRPGPAFSVDKRRWHQKWSLLSQTRFIRLVRNFINRYQEFNEIKRLLAAGNTILEGTEPDYTERKSKGECRLGVVTPFTSTSVFCLAIGAALPKTLHPAIYPRTKFGHKSNQDR